jgi:Predicted site-specific integrase-resolvase
MMLRPKEVCQRLGISYATVREYVKKGYIKPVLEIGKWRFREDVEKLMRIVRKRTPPLSHSQWE